MMPVLSYPYPEPPQITDDPCYIYNKATLNFLEILKRSNKVDVIDIQNIRDCMNYRFFAEKTCEHGHKSMVYGSCSDEVFCPRCNERNALERMDSIISKFEYFQYAGVCKFVFTVPENMRDMVYADKKKFVEVVRNSLNGFFEGWVGGFYVVHDYSTEKPWVLNPHVEVYVSDLVLTDRKYEGVRKTVCRTNKKTGKTQVFNPEKNISFKEAWDKKHGRSVYSDRKPRVLSGDFRRIKDLFFSESRLDWLKVVYSELFKNAFGCDYVKLNVYYHYYQKGNQKSVDSLKFHAIPYSLKMPFAPASVMDVSDVGVVTYVTNRDGVDVVVMDTVDNVVKVFDYDYYSKNRQKRICWFGFMSDGVWRDYAKLLSGVFPELKPKCVVEGFNVCPVCSADVVFVRTNYMFYKLLCEGFDIKHEFVDL